ncbi:MAG: Smr/MutS family protein [Myxococcota bacterium]
MELATSLLELDTIRSALRSRVRTPLGTREVTALTPFGRREEAEERIRAVAEARSLLEMGETAPVFGGEEVEAYISLAEKELRLEGGQLRAVADTMLAAFELRRHLVPREHEVPQLYGLGVSLPDLSGPARDIKRCFDPDGTLSDDASADLGPLRQKVRRLRESIQDKLEELLKNPSIERYLQERYFTIRGDRHVLPVIASYKTHISGIVHDASGSGQTVYIEPQALIDLGNRLKIAMSEQADEENRILSRLSRVVAHHGEGVRTCCMVIGRVDFLNGAARLAVDIDAVPIVPSHELGFALRAARHPGLVLQSVTPDVIPEEEERAPCPVVDKDHPRFEVVANDLALEAEQRVLVLTGPNTGGKTVAMKTIGLMALLVRCGLHLPCHEKSEIGWFDPIVGTIGDQQSLASNLSTFAAHMKALLSVLRMSKPGTLVLVDEIAADTDPLQGQAIAQAILEQVADRGAHAVVTTHFERLKAVPFQDGRFRNAGVGFDEQALKPTYRVTLDVPQSSSALDIASGLGLPSSIVDRARELLGTGVGSLESLIKTVEQRARELEEARDEERTRTRALEKERSELLRKQKQLEAEIEKVRERARNELLVEIAEARAQTKSMIAELQRAAESESSADAMRIANQTAAQLKELERREAERLPASVSSTPESDGVPEELQVGQWVHVLKLGRDAEVVSIEGKEVQVSVGTLRMRVSQSSLRSAKSLPPKKKPSKRSKPRLRDVVQATKEPERDVSERIDLRGHSIDESIERLEAFLDYHYGQPTKHVLIVHGHGTGALRDAIREHLSRSGYVKSLRPGERDEGGDGATIVSLT